VARTARTTERRHEVIQRTDRGGYELGAIRGCDGARVSNKPHSPIVQRQRAARRRGWQRETVVGAIVRVHILAGTVPGAAKVHVRRW